jgi:hypothetical protein
MVHNQKTIEEWRSMTSENELNNCRLYYECTAQLCPLDNNSLNDCLWYPDGQVCRSRKFSRLSWLKTQKKIAKLKLSPDIGFFTVDMLELINRVSRGIKGANPDKPCSKDRWLEQRKKAQRTSARIALLV